MHPKGEQNCNCSKSRPPKRETPFHQFARDGQTELFARLTSMIVQVALLGHPHGTAEQGDFEGDKAP